jgi:hypothetical protein
MQSGGKTGRQKCALKMNGKIRLPVSAAGCPELR